MVCPYCKGETSVSNSRLMKRSNFVWRRRSCLHCKAVFSTEESIVNERALKIDKFSVLEPFVRDKLYISIFDSLSHRKQAYEDATSLTATIVNMVYDKASQGVIKIELIKDLAYRVLYRFDKYSATYYKAHHKLN